MKKRVKVISMILLVFYIVALAFSFKFSAEQRNHDCIGEDCPVCAVLRIVEKISDGAKKIAAVAVFFVAYFSVVFILFNDRGDVSERVTPVSLNDLQLS